MVSFLVLDLQSDGETFFISYGTRFHNLDPKLLIVSVPKCGNVVNVVNVVNVCGKCVPLLRF